MTLQIPANALVLLVGVAGVGKSTFARRHFESTQVLSSDHCRALIADDPADQGVSKDAFEVLHLIAAKRLKTAHLTVIDATNVTPGARRSLLALAEQYLRPRVAIVFALPLEDSLRQNQLRRDRVVEEQVIRTQSGQLQDSLGGLAEEGFERIYRLETLAQARACRVEFADPIP